MVDKIQTSIQSMLIDRYNAFSYGSPDVIHRQQPNVAFTAPEATQTAWWLRATLLPADSFRLSVGKSSNQHYGIFQIDVFHGLGAGEYPATRIADEIIDWFPVDLRLTKNGFIVDIKKKAYRGNAMKQTDPWIMIPVSIPYLAFGQT